jgi:hypothetical protein
MTIRELRIEPDALLLIIESAKGEPALPKDTRITDVALDHGHTATHRDRPPTIVLQISSSEFIGPELSVEQYGPITFRR